MAGTTPPCPAGCEIGPLTGILRADCAREVRRTAAEVEHPPGVGVPAHSCNNDEVLFQAANYLGNFSKGLRHDALGEVDPAAYCALLAALDSGNRADFEALEAHLGCRDVCTTASGGVCDRLDVDRQRKLENPQAGYAFDLEGVDAHQAGPLAVPGCELDDFPAPPAFSSVDEIDEMAEIYWMALARDVPFTEYATDPLIAAAVADLNAFSLFQEPLGTGILTPQTIFRGSADNGFDHPAPPDGIGPYVSQFLLLDVPYGAQLIPARIRTVLANVDYLTVYEDWLNAQNGCDFNQVACDPTARLIRNGRDLGQFVHVDTVHQAFFNACLLLQMGRDTRRCEAGPGLGTPYAAGLPYRSPFAPRLEDPPGNPPGPGKSATQIGVTTFGPQHVETLVMEVTTRALKAAWYQKWLVHRRLRPEEFGGRIHNHVTGNKPGPGYPFDLTPIGFPAGGPPPPPTSLLGRVFAHNTGQNANRRQSDGVGISNLPVNPTPNEPTYLLPMAFAEGSPLHPAYAAGHATVAGACVTILKAFFAEDQRIVNPVIPNPAGTALVAYTGPGADDLTVGGELDKLASNVSLGRNFAGVHWRSDHRESIKLGEAVAVRLLVDQAFTYNEDFEMRFHRFNGDLVTISKTGGSGPKTVTLCGQPVTTVAC